MNRLLLCFYISFLTSAFVSTKAAIWVNDSFDYAQGLLTNASPFWIHSSGNEGEIEVMDQSLLLDENKSEDVFIEMANAPDEMIYAGFDILVEGMPSGEGNYFAHFRGASTTTFRGRSFLLPSEESGKLRIGIANGSNEAGESIQHHRPISLNIRHRIVIAYDPEMAQTRLWIDPSNEASGFVIAADSTSPREITSFAFRQSLVGGNGMGILKIDNLIIASRFEEVQKSMPIEPTPNIPRISVSPISDLQIIEAGTALEIELRASNLDKEIAITITAMSQLASQEDFSLSATTLLLSPEQSSITLLIEAIDDAMIELEETILLTFQSDDAVIFEPASLQLILLDNDRGGLLLQESFSYPDSPLTQNAEWQRHSGAEQSTRVQNQTLILTDSSTEDSHILIPGFPYEMHEAITLFAAFDLNILQSPEGSGSYFAHFKGSTINAFRGRIHLQTQDTGVQIGLDGAAGLPIYSDILLSNASPYRIVLGYELSSGVASLWINPTNQTDVTLISQSESALLDIESFAFRQTGSAIRGLGELVIDNLLIGTSFESVSQSSPTLPVITLHATHSSTTEAGAANWEVSRTGDLSRALRIRLGLSGTAILGEDFDLNFDPHQLQFESNVERMSLGLFPLDDAIDEPDETAILSILVGAGYQLGNETSASITLIDDDDPEPEPEPNPDPDDSSPPTIHISRSGLRIFTPLGIRFELEESSDLIHWQRIEEFVGGDEEWQHSIEWGQEDEAFFRLKRIE